MMRSSKIRAFLASLLLLVFILSACAQKTPTPTPLPTTPAATEVPATLAPIPTETATATPTLLAVEPSTSSNFGLIVFSMGDGIYTHLFVYDPYSIPVTRLTADKWDDIEPAVSPDGKQIAFASNRDGQWDIYILDVSLDKVTRVTQTKTYDGSPEWSPDGQNLVYQTLNGNNLDLVIQAVSDPNSTPIQITADAGDNFDAAWSPDGRQIAFTTNRYGRNQIWLFNLKSSENRFAVVASSDQADYLASAWSPDGNTLAWCKKDSEDHIEALPISSLDTTPKLVGLGCSPTWSPDGKSILATYQAPNSQYFIAYDFFNDILSLPLISAQAQIQSSDWIDAGSAKYLLNYINLQSPPAPVALFTTAITMPKSEMGRYGVVELSDVNTANAYLSDTSDESFKALRLAFGKKIGWDFLASLDNAYLPLSATTYPGIIQNWLFSGRAIAVKSAALSADWMTVTREDYEGKTYWRVWVKCLDQSGICGQPIRSHIWDFSSRSSGNLQAYEDGGIVDGTPQGYWVDFTEFAARFGWERLPAQNNWRYYYPGSLFNQFVFRQGLTWRQAMLQLYPTDAVDLLAQEN